jgi:hypothetical protein
MSGARTKVTGHCMNVQTDHLVIRTLSEHVTLRAQMYEDYRLAGTVLPAQFFL